MQSKDLVPKDKTIWYALQQNARIVTVLIVRTAITRFGNSRFGLFWVFAEPAAFIAIFVLAHTYVQSRIAFGDNAALFVLSGVFGFRMTRGISRKAERGILSNMPLLTYPLIKPIDGIVAAFTFESIVWLVICALFLTGLSFTMDRPLIVYPGEFLECISAILYFAFAFSMFNATIGALIPRYTTALSMMNLPLMMLSGIFYMPIMMPPEMQAILYWNPFVHCVEWFRVSTYLDYIPLLDRAYLLSVSTAMLTSSLVVERMCRRQILDAT